MASAGGHWTKATSGPYAGKATFVPATKSLTMQVGTYGKFAPADAIKQGGLASVNIDGKWYVYELTPDGKLGNYYGGYASKQLAKGKMTNMNAAGYAKTMNDPEAHLAISKVGAVVKKPGGVVAAPKVKPTKAQKEAFPDVDELYGSATTANDTLKLHFDKHGSALTDNQRSSLFEYQDGHYKKINGVLWGSKLGKEIEAGVYGPELKKSVNAHVKNIDAAMAKSPGLPTNIRLYRRTEWTEGGLYQWASAAKVGATYKNKGYDSTSVDKGFNQGGAVRLVYNAPKGLKGFYMNAHPNSIYPSEREYLLPRNTAWRVAKKTQHGSVIEIELDYIGG